MAKKKTDLRERPRGRQPTPLRELRVAVVGLNGVGRGIAQLLASCGVGCLLLVDRRTVTKRARLVAGYGHEDAGRMRSHATAQACHALNPLLDVQTRTTLSMPILSNMDTVFRCAEIKRPPEGQTQPVVTIDLAGERPNWGTIALCGESYSGSSGYMAPRAVATLAAGMAVQALLAHLKGIPHRHTRRFTLGDVDFAITLD